MENKKFYNGMNDGVFKAIFANEKDKSLLEFFLSKALEQKVTVKKILNPEMAKLNAISKGKTLDVLAELEDKTIANIKLNSCYYTNLHRRNAAYIFGKYSDDAKRGETYSDMHKHIQINITGGLPKEEPELLTYKLTCQEIQNKAFIDNLEIYEYNVNSALTTAKTSKDKYSFIAMLGAKEDDLNDICRGDENMEKYKEKVEDLNNDPDFYYFLSAEEDAKKVQNTLKAEAREEGHAEGHAEGFAEGIKKRNIEIAKNLLNIGIDIKDIVKATGLSIEEIKNLK